MSPLDCLPAKIVTVGLGAPAVTVELCLWDVANRVRPDMSPLNYGFRPAHQWPRPKLSPLNAFCPRVTALRGPVSLLNYGFGQALAGGGAKTPMLAQVGHVSPLNLAPKVSPLHYG